jgi:pyrroloquinoline quinone biosynthesis protein E
MLSISDSSIRQSFFPALKRQYNIRISKGRILFKDLRTEDCTPLDSKEILLFSLLDGKNTIAIITHVLANSINLALPEATEYVQCFLDKNKGKIDFLNSPADSPCVADLSKLLDFRSRRWPYSALREENPYSLELILTEECNHRCVYCYKSCAKAKTDQCSSSMWSALIDDAAAIGVQEMTFSGGEPTLHPDFLSLIKKATHNGIYPKISTNGSLLDSGFIDSLSEAGAEYIHLSLPAVSHGIYDKITASKGHFDKTTQAIRHLKKRGFYIRAKMVIIPENLDEVRPLIEFCIDEGIDFIHLAPFILTSKGRGSKEMLTQAKQIRAIQEICMEETTIYGKAIKIAEPPVYCYRWAGCNDIIKCGGIKESLTILSNGDITFCDALGENKDFLLGNIKTNSLQSIWLSDLPDAITRIKGKNLEKACKDCPFLKDCGTGCFAFSLLTNGDPWSPDPRCWKSKTAENPFAEIAGIDGNDTARLPNE